MWSAGMRNPSRCRAVCSLHSTHGAARLFSPFTVPTTRTSLPLIFALSPTLTPSRRVMSDSSTMTASGMVSKSSCSRLRTVAAPAEPKSVLNPSR